MRARDDFFEIHLASSVHAYVPRGALIMISAPVNLFPQRYSPSLGEVASCDSRKSKVILRLGLRYPAETAFVIMRTSGRRKKGAPVLMSAVGAQGEG